MGQYEMKLPIALKKKKDTDADIIDGIIQTIMTNDPRPSKKSPPTVNDKLPKEKMKFLLNTVNTLLLREATLLEIEPPIVIFGDTHGQFGDLLDIVDNVGWVPERRYLFMGDYVDRGDNSIELISLLFALKVRYPDNVYLLRGNHETAEVNADYGFRSECLRDYDISIWDAFQESFKCLPLVALVGREILCMHGGLSPSLASIDDVKKIPRPLDVPVEGWVCDVLWADPTPSKEHLHAASTSDHAHHNCCGFSPNRIRGTSVWFGSDAVEEFLKRNEIGLVVRGHEMVEAGYDFSYNKKVLTIFSAPNYCEHPNDASVLSVDDDLRCFVWVFKFPKPPESKHGVFDTNVFMPMKNFIPCKEPPREELWNEVTLRSRQGEDNVSVLQDILHSSDKQAKSHETEKEEKRKEEKIVKELKPVYLGQEKVAEHKMDEKPAEPIVKVSFSAIPSLGPILG